MIGRCLSAVCAAALAFGSAHADEVWRSEQDDSLIVYETDIGTTAVLSAQADKLGRFAVYAPGLGGVWGGDRRSSYDGYYIGFDEGGPCEASLTGVDERVSHNWGRARLVLTDRGFPTTILLLLSPCGGTDETLIVGKPMVGG